MGITPDDFQAQRNTLYMKACYGKIIFVRVSRLEQLSGLIPEFFSVQLCQVIDDIGVCPRLE